MGGGGLALASIGVAAWAAVLGVAGSRRSVYRRIVEAVLAQVVVSTLVSVALVSGGVFRVAAAQALAALIPLALLLRSGQRPWSSLREAPFITRLELITLLMLVLVSPVALPRMATLYFEDDAGVYSNRALHHLHAGSAIGTVPVRDRLEGPARERFDRDNFYRPGVYRRGTAPVDPGSSRFVFQFFPGWPMLMAQWAGLFGVTQMFGAVLFAFAMAVLLFGFLLEAAGLGVPTFAATVALFASSPLLLYFSAYTTSEAFLLLLFLLVVHFLGQGGVAHTALAAAGVLGLVVTHVSVFAYAPLLLLVALEAYVSGSRRLAWFSVAAMSALLASLPAGWLFSPGYAHDIYGAVFARLGVENPAWVGQVLLAGLYLAGLGVSLVALRRAGSTPSPKSPLGRWLAKSRALLPLAIRAVLAALCVGMAYRAYQLGWTDRFAAPRGGGAWAAREQYAGTGWEALAHLNVVSMVMATALVALPFVLAVALVWGEKVCATPRRRFLLAGLVLCLGIFTVLRLDTPHNYYASRYFIPVFVPVTMLLFGQLIDAFRVRTRWVAALALVGLAFNLHYARALQHNPTYSDEMRFVEDVAARVGDNRVLFARNLWRKHRMVRRLLAFPLAQVHGISQISVLGREGSPADEAIVSYARQLRLRDAAVLSLEPPSDGRAFATVELTQKMLVQARFYPHSSVERVHRFYLYNVAFEPTPATGAGAGPSPPSS